MDRTAVNLIVGIIASAIVAVATYWIGWFNGYSDGEERGVAAGRDQVLSEEAEKIREILREEIEAELTDAILEDKCKQKIALVQQEWEAKLTQAEETGKATIALVEREWKAKLTQAEETGKGTIALVEREWEAKLTQAENDCNARISTTRTEAYDKGFADAEQQNFVLQFLDWYERILRQTSEAASAALEEPNADLQQTINSAVQAIIAAIEQQRDFAQEYAKILNGEHDKLREALKNKDYKTVNEIMVALTMAFEIRRKAIMEELNKLQAQQLKN